MTSLPSIPGQRLSHAWYGPAYFDALALHFAASLPTQQTYTRFIHLKK